MLSSSDLLKRRRRSRHSLARIVVVASCVLSSQGCSESQTRPQVVRDSAGIQIVDNPGPIRTLAGSRLLSIGGLTDQFDVGSPSGAALLSTGIVLADSSNRLLRYFDENGVWIRNIGRSGRGPGEFQNIAWLRRTVGDSSVLIDRANRRATWLVGDSIVSSVPIRLPPRAQEDVPHGLFEDSIFLTFSVDDGKSKLQISLATSHAEIHRLEMRGSDETQIRHSENGETVTAIVLAPLGRRVVLAAGRSEWVIVASDKVGYQRFSAFGKLLQVANVKVPVRRSERQDLERYKEEYVGFGGTPFWRSLRASVIDAARPGSQVPLVDAAFVSGSGEVWVRRFEPGNSTRGWYIFGINGKLIGLVNLPAGNVLDVRDDRVLIVSTDSLGVQTVSVWRVRRNGA